MKSYEERIEAVSEARMKSQYAETEELIEIFIDGDDLWLHVTHDTDSFYCVPLQPKD